MFDPWEMFYNTDMGENLEEVVETENCKVLRYLFVYGLIGQLVTYQPIDFFDLCKWNYDTGE